jgi:hypothetical protein
MEAGHDPHRRARRWLTLITAGACVVLVPWTIGLVLTLPRHYTASHWRLTWVGLDIAQAYFLARTAWLTYKRRRIRVVSSAVITGTLLCVDAWFDVVTATGPNDRVASLVTAVFGELPLAILLFVVANRIMRWLDEEHEAYEADLARRGAEHEDSGEIVP